MVETLPLPISYPDVEETPVQKTLLFGVECARFAPSGHNRQPWKFRLGEDYVDVFADPTRNLPIIDPQERELFISCGTALFYLRLALRYAGYQDIVQETPDPWLPYWLARVYLGKSSQRSASDALLFQAISRRHTNRLPFFKRAVANDLPEKLAQVARQEGAVVKIIESDGVRESCSRLIGEGVRALAAMEGFSQEMNEWYHPQHTKGTDGIAHLSAEIGELLTHSVPLVTSVSGVDLLVQQERSIVENAPLLIALGSEDDSSHHLLWVGQGLAHLLLLAAANGVNATFLNYPLQVETLRPLVREAILLQTKPQILMAMGYAPAVSPSVRRPLKELLIHD